MEDTDIKREYRDTYAKMVRTTSWKLYGKVRKFVRHSLSDKVVLEKDG